jgi:hypothetical protein
MNKKSSTQIETQDNYDKVMFSKQFRTCIFLIIYQIIFNKSIGIACEHIDIDTFLESIKDEYPELFEPQNDSINLELRLQNELKGEPQTHKYITTDIKSLKDNLEVQIASFDKQLEVMTDKLQVHLSDWSKTFGIVKAVLYCYLLEQNLADNSLEFQNKSVGLYIKLAEEFTILANIKLIHAILSKLQSK